MQPLILHIETYNNLSKVMHLESDSQDQVPGVLTLFMKGTYGYAPV